MDVQDKDEPVLETRNLTRTYSREDGVRKLTFSFPRGTFYALLGPNGAGKSTTLYLLLGLIHPNQGTAKMNGHDVFQYPEKSKRHVGVLLEEPSFYPGMTAQRNLLSFHRHRPEVDRAEVRRVIEEVGLSPGSKHVRNFSSGMKQRLGIARALAGRPDLVLLDEPTANLDPEGRDQILSLFKRYHREEQVSFLYCTHRIEEAEELCTRVGILKQGTLQEQRDWPPETSREPSWITIRIKTGIDAAEAALSSMNVPFERKGEKNRRLHVKNEEHSVNTILRPLLKEQVEIRDVRPRTSTLLDLYRNA